MVTPAKKLYIVLPSIKTAMIKKLLKGLSIPLLAAALTLGCEKEWVCQDGEYPVDELSYENFNKKVLESEMPYAVVFSDPICIYCPEMKDNLRNLAPELGCRLNMGIHEVLWRQDADIFHTYQEEGGMPATACFHNGELQFMFKGAVDKSYLERKLRDCAEFYDGP